MKDRPRVVTAGLCVTFGIVPIAIACAAIASAAGLDAETHATTCTPPPSSAPAPEAASEDDVPWSVPEAELMGRVYPTAEKCRAALDNCSGGCERCGRIVYPDCCKSSAGWVFCGEPTHCSCPKACE